ncbi:MAG: 4Fe-4S binding protein [Firmicutes bacterium]|nr:4Fe-4S binding protein [Bacillota bacterium]
MSLAYKVITVEVEKGFFHLFPALCKGCGLCKEKCPKGCLIWSNQLGAYSTPTVIPDAPENCIACGICEIVCPDCAIKIEKKKK